MNGRRCSEQAIHSSVCGCLWYVYAHGPSIVCARVCECGCANVDDTRVHDSSKQLWWIVELMAGKLLCCSSASCLSLYHYNNQLLDPAPLLHTPVPLLCFLFELGGGSLRDARGMMMRLLGHRTRAHGGGTAMHRFVLLLA